MQSVTSFTDCNVTYAIVSILSWPSEQGSATPESDENTIKTTAQMFQWPQWIISKKDVQIIAQGKMTTDYCFAIDLTGKNCQLMNLRKETN